MAFLSTTSVPRVNLHILRRDFFDGCNLLLQDADGTPFDLGVVTLSATIWKVTDSSTPTLVTALNVQRLEPYTSGRVRLWLSSTQTGLVWDAASGESVLNRPLNQAFFPTAYAAANGGETAFSSTLMWDVRIERQEKVSDLVSVASGVFTTQTDHGLGATDRIIFRDTNQSALNYNGTSDRIYTTLSALTYVAPYQFTVAALSGTSANPLGGAVYRLRQDTVVAGDVFVGTTYSNSFT